MLPYADIGTEGENLLVASPGEDVLRVLADLAQDSTLAATLFEESCESCHGPRGERGLMNGAPSLADGASR